ncbi:MAG: hypothetical protein IJH75_01385 [Mogibacterium sp.]|nr:hypothetical protein [Mogibacterium sp.]
MNKNSDKLLRKLLASGLALTLMLSQTAVLCAAEAGLEGQDPESSPVTETSEPATSQAPAAPSSDAPAPAVSDAAADETAESAPAQNQEAAPEPAATPAAKSGSVDSAASSIQIGGTSFSAGEDESSHWSEGKGWKNIAGQYVAMVDYDGSQDALSADSGVVKLAVAGINRIGSLEGNCSYQIIGSGIVLIDNINLAEGQTVTLHPDTSLYDEGSAAVFLKQEDGSYLLKNGTTTGILDEEYILDNIRLTIPKDACLKLGAMVIRTEEWLPEDATEIETDVTRYTTDVPDGANEPVLGNGPVDFQDVGARLVIGKNATLTVNDGASVKLMEIVNNATNYLPYTLKSELIIRGILDVKGVVEGGCVNIEEGGTLTGTGKVLSSEVDLHPAGNLSEDVLLEDSALTVHAFGNDNWRSVSAKIKDSVIYLKGTNINIPELIVSGVSRLCVDTATFSFCKVGDITLTKGSDLAILANEHDYWSNDRYGEGIPDRLLEDCGLEIYGKISGGTVSVLAGCVEYTGSQTDVLPAVPDDFASRALVTKIDMETSDLPLNMTPADAAARLKQDQIPVTEISVLDTLVSPEILARQWDIGYILPMDPLTREKDQTFTVDSFLAAYGISTEGETMQSEYYTALEVIRSDLSRERLWPSDPTEFSTDDVILIRVLKIHGRGGQGGGSATHTTTSFTGSGVLGGTGAGSVKAGSGTTVIIGTSSPVTPPDDPGDGDGGGGNTDTRPAIRPVANNRVVRTAAARTATSAAATDDLVVTVSVLEPTNEAPADTDPALPQLWQLTVTRAGTPITDLTGNAVRVVLPFVAPEDWGTPEEIAQESLYAVFADENGKLTAYEAQYDPATGEVQFDAEQTGAFVIVRFSYEEEPFTEDFYRALAELPEVQAFLTVLGVNAE